MRKKTDINFLLLLLTLVSGCATSNVVSDGADSNLMLRGNDPVAYFTMDKAVKGDPGINADHDGLTYRFINNAHRDMFQRDPKKYVRSYGGTCAGGANYALKTPVGAEYVIQAVPDTSPAKWHLAQTTWSFENFVLLPLCPGYRVFHERYLYLCNSYYETVGRMDRGSRGDQFDAILFNYMRDISRTNAAIAQLFRFAKTDARVAIAGMKYFPWWTGPLNFYAFFKNRAYNGIAGGLWTPWDIVAQYVPDLQISSTQFGMGYIAHGTAQRPFAAPSVSSS